MPASAVAHVIHITTSSLTHACNAQDLACIAVTRNR